MAAIVSGIHTTVHDIATFAMISPRAGGPSYRIVSGPQFFPDGSEMSPTVVKSRTPLRFFVPAGDADEDDVGAPKSFSLRATSETARLERFPRSAPRRASKSSSVSSAAPSASAE
jgi:hypothetical protein